MITGMPFNFGFSCRRLCQFNPHNVWSSLHPVLQYPLHGGDDLKRFSLAEAGCTLVTFLLENGIKNIENIAVVINNQTLKCWFHGLWVLEVC